MQSIKEEITALETTDPPKDFTVDHVGAWLNAIRANPTNKAIRLLIERIDVIGKDDFDLSEKGCEPPQPQKTVFSKEKKNKRDLGSAEKIV